jgi:hypothetical protein
VAACRLALVTVAFAAVLVPAAFSADVVTGPPSDPLGDVTNAPDVTNVALLHPSPGSALVITVQVANELVLANGSVIEARFDTDMNPSTGSQSGTERLVQHLWNGSTRLCTWTGAAFSCASSPATTSTYVNGLLTATTTTDALGITESGFDYSFAAYRAPEVDFVPDSGTWRYSLAPPTWGCLAAPGLECVGASR